MATAQPTFRAATARRAPSDEQVVASGMTLALGRREAIVHGIRVHLTPVETRFMGVLASTDGRPLSTEQLLARVWGGSDHADPVYVWVTIRRLRQKLEADPSDPQFIHTVRGRGYRLGDPSPG